jgi:hypothetical protein
MATVPVTNPSGTTGFFLANGDIILESFDRIQKRPSSLTQAQLVSAYRSINLELSTWSNRPGPNLWKRTLNTIQLTAGQETYNLPTTTIQMLDVYIRQYPMSGAVSIPLNFTTISTQKTVTIGWADHGLIVGNYVNIVVPVSVGGLILLGFYTVTSVPNGNTIIITAPSAATSSDSPGHVPLFTTVSSSSTVTVTLPNHGMTSGQNFNIQVQTTVSDVVLYGSYIIETIVDANNFTITGPNPAFAGASVYENAGEAFIAGQNNADTPNDRILYPMSETDYASLPNKFQQGEPTSYFYNRQSPTPNVTLWLVPGSTTGPYALQYWATEQIQDSNLGMGQTPDIPYRFFEALCAGIAARLAQKFAPQMWQLLKADALAQWQEAALGDSERVSIYLSGDMSDYFL